MAPKRPIEPLVVSVTNAAVMLGVTRQHCYQLIERGVLRRIQIAGSTAVRVPIEDVYAALGMEAPAPANARAGAA